MNQNKFYGIGTKVWCFIYSRSEPDIYIPLRGKVSNTYADPITPLYGVSPIRFIDKIHFLRKYMLNNQYFPTDLNGDTRTRPLSISPNRIETRDQLVRELNEKGKFFVVEEQLVFNFYNDMMFYFKRLQDHLIDKEINKLKDRMVQKPYNDCGGSYSVPNKEEFTERIEKGFGDLIRERYDRQEDINTYYREISK